MIAIAGPNLPLEMLAATGRYAGPVSFDPDRETPQASQWLESKFAPWARPVLEAWVQGEYDHLKQILFSRADDTSQRFYYYACELQRRGMLGGPEPLILDVAKIPRPTSLERTTAKLRELGDRLGVSSEALEAAIVQQNASRESSSNPPDSPVCLLAGTPPPDLRLHKAIAAKGFNALGQTLTEEWSDRAEPVEEGTGDPFSALALRLQAHSPGPRSFADPGATLAASIERCKAQAVILWRIEEDEAQCWHLPAERKAIDATGIPSLVLTRRDWLARDGVIGEIATFLEEIRP